MAGFDLGPEAQLNYMLSRFLEKDQIRFALSVPQAVKLIEKLSVQVAESLRYSILKDGLFAIVAASGDKSVLCCAHIDDIETLAGEVVRVGNKSGNDPNTEGLFAGAVMYCIDKFGSNAREKTEPVVCQDGPLVCITMHNARQNFDMMRKVIGLRGALAYVILASDNGDGVMAAPVVYGLTYREGKNYGDKS